MRSRTLEDFVVPGKHLLHLVDLVGACRQSPPLAGLHTEQKIPFWLGRKFWQRRARHTVLVHHKLLEVRNCKVHLLLAVPLGLVLDGLKAVDQRPVEHSLCHLRTRKGCALRQGTADSRSAVF